MQVLKMQNSVICQLKTDNKFKLTVTTNDQEPGPQKQTNKQKNVELSNNTNL